MVQVEADLDQVLDDVQPFVLLLAIVAGLRRPQSIFQQLPDVPPPLVRADPFEEGVLEGSVDIWQREVGEHDGHFGEGAAVLFDELLEQLQPTLRDLFDFVAAVPDVEEELELEFLDILALEEGLDAVHELLELARLHVGVLVEGPEEQVSLALLREPADFVPEGLEGLVVAPLEEVVGKYLLVGTEGVGLAVLAVAEAVLEHRRQRLLFKLYLPYYHY